MKPNWQRFRIGRTAYGVLLLACFVGCWVYTASAQIRGRVPVGPDVWYPGNPAELYQAITQYLHEADVAPRNARLTAIVVPNGPYQRSGKVAAHAYTLLKPGQYDRVIILSPSYTARFEGCSMPSVQFYRTPLGDVPTDTATLDRLNRSTLINLRSVLYQQGAYARGRRIPIHEVEHGIEVQLPFLQVQLGEFSLIPILVGDLVDTRGRVDHGAIEAVADTIRRVMDDRTLLVVSANFTRHGPQFGNMRHRRDVLQGVARDDMALFDRILDRDIAGFHRTVEEQGDAVAGRAVLALMLHLLPRRASGVVLSYDTSGRITGDTTNSTSYAAIAFFDPGSPPNEQREVRTLTSGPPREPDAEETTQPEAPSETEESEESVNDNE